MYFYSLFDLPLLSEGSSIPGGGVGIRVVVVVVDDIVVSRVIPRALENRFR